MVVVAVAGRPSPVASILLQMPLAFRHADAPKQKVAQPHIDGGPVRALVLETGDAKIDFTS